MPVKCAIVAVLLCISTAVIAQDSTGAICVAPIGHEAPTTAGTPELACESGNFTFRIDSGNSVAWPKDEGLSVTGLDLKMRHRVVVLCDGKPQQAFKFRLSEYNTGRACLWLNDLYLTAQLWEPRQAPWCKCKPSVEMRSAQDKVLFNRAKAAIHQNRFDVASLALQTLLNTYPTSEYAAEAKSLLQDPRIAQCGHFTTTPENCEGAAQTHPSR